MSHEWALLKRFSRSEVKGKGHDQIKCYNDQAYTLTMASRLTCFAVLYILVYLLLLLFTLV